MGMLGAPAPPFVNSSVFQWVIVLLFPVFIAEIALESVSRHGLDTGLF